MTVVHRQSESLRTLLESSVRNEATIPALVTWTKNLPLCATLHASENYLSFDCLLSVWPDMWDQ